MVKKLLKLLIIPLSMFWFVNVHAFVNGQKFSEYLILYADFQGWTSTSTYKSLGTGFQLDSSNANTNNQVAYYYIPDPSLYNDTNGTSVKTYINGQIIKDNQVELSVGICTNRSSLDFIDYSALYLIDNNGGLNYQTFTAYTVNDVGTFVTDIYTFKCKEIYMTFTANVTSTSFMYRFYSNTTKPMGFVAYMGYHLNINGIDYTSQFNNLSNQNQILINQQQTIINQNTQTNEKLDNIDNTIKDSGIDNPDFEEFEDYIAENGVITQLITLPVRLYTQILNSINSSCTPFVLGEMFGHNLVMDCIEPSEFFGVALWNTIDILGSGLFIYAISKKMIAVFHQFTNLEEGDILD